VSMLTLDGGLNLLVGHVVVTALDDIGAYFVGVRFGSRKLAPSLSPAKSWEGFLGGFAIALCAGVTFGMLMDELSWLDGLAIAAIIGMLAPAGDLAESMAKRELGIKDSGRLLPGGSLISADRPNVVIETVKAAEDGRGFVVRLYESQRQRGSANLMSGIPLGRAYRTNLLEEDESELEIRDGTVLLQLRPYEIVTLRLLPAS
jgi:hypothetical protein